MSKSILSLIFALVCCHTSSLAQDIPLENPPPPGQARSNSPADIAWGALRDKKNKALGNSSSRSASAKVSDALECADAAKAFYSHYPDHFWANEARNIEIFSYIAAANEGDPGSIGKLESAAADLRRQQGVPAKAKARGIAAYAFATSIRNVRSEDARRAAVETAARELLTEFPGEPQGYEALWALCQAAPIDRSTALARELSVSTAAPAVVKSGAAALAARYALVGKPISEVLPVAAPLFAKLRQNEPALIYTWSESAPGSIVFGQIVQARRFNAVAVCLDDDVAAATKAALAAGLGGQLVYDPKAGADPWIQALKLTNPGLVVIIDSQGVIRDVRGAEHFEEKVSTFGFQTPVLTRP